MATTKRREYDEFFGACYLPVVRTVFLVVHDRMLAEDVAQEAFYRLLKHWRSVSTYELPEAWVRRVAIRIAVREVQRSAARVAKERRELPVHHDDLPDPDVIHAVGSSRPCSARPSSSTTGRTVPWSRSPTSSRSPTPR